MTTRLIMAIISTTLEEAAIVVIVLFGLPKIDIEMPIPVLIILMVAWIAYSVTVYRMGSRALRRKPVINLPVVGSRGTVVNALAPEGLIKIQSELWIARSNGGEINPGEEVIVVEQDGLRLVVRVSDSNDVEDGPSR